MGANRVRVEGVKRYPLIEQPLFPALSGLVDEQSDAAPAGEPGIQRGPIAMGSVTVPDRNDETGLPAVIHGG